MRLSLLHFFFKHVTSLYYNVHFSVSRKNKDDGETMSVAACLINKLLNHCELLKKKKHAEPYVCVLHNMLTTSSSKLVPYSSVILDEVVRMTRKGRYS